MTKLENEPLEFGCRCKVKGTTFYGRFEGFTDKTKKKARFFDEELGTVKIYYVSKLERTYEKLY